MSFFQLSEGVFNWLLFVGRDFIAVFFQLLFSLENQTVGLVDFFNFFFRFAIGFGIGFGFLLHLLDFFFAQSRRCFDADALLFVRSLVFRRNVDDTVGVYVKSYFNLWYASWCWWNSIQVKSPDGAVVF